MKTLTTEKLKSKPLAIRRIIVAVDLTKNCEATVRYAAEIAKHYHASLCVVSVFWPYKTSQGNYYYLMDQEQREFRHQLEDLAAHVRGTVPRCTSALLVGRPAERIAALARDVHADLIVTSSYNPMFLTRLFALDKAVKIVYQAPCSVLVYHETD